MNKSSFITRLAWIVVFGIAMAYVESAVVVYLRAIFHPEGFTFPLKVFVDSRIIIEVFREAATIVMLLAVACLAGKKSWERFGYFMLAFGVWDIFYYVWLKVLLDWPSTIFEWDVLFLIPVTWIGPVIAPVSVALLMTVFGVLIAASFRDGREFRPSFISFILAIAGMAVILYSFMYDTDATFQMQMPRPYRYDLLIAGNLLFTASFIVSYFNSKK
jgi:hypothetical protein